MQAKRVLSQELFIMCVERKDRVILKERGTLMRVTPPIHLPSQKDAFVNLTNEHLLHCTLSQVALLPMGSRFDAQSNPAVLRVLNLLVFCIIWCVR